MTVFTFALKRSFRNLPNVFLLCVLPIAVIFLPTDDWFTLPLGFQYYGILLLFAASRMVHFIMEDRINGVVQRIGVAPLTHLSYLSQHLLAYSLLLVAQSALVVMGGVVYGHDLVAPLWLFIVYAFFAVTAIGFSLAWCSLFRSKEASLTVMMCVIMLMAMMGGLFWPVAVMPDFMQRIAMLLPTYWLVKSTEIITTATASIELIVPLTVLFLFTVAFLLVGSRGEIA